MIHHRRHAHAGHHVAAAIAAITHAVKHDPEDKEYDEDHDEHHTVGRLVQRRLALLILLAQLHMERGAQRAHRRVIVALLHVVCHAGGNEALRKAAEQIVKIAAGKQVVVLLLFCDEQNGVILAKLHLHGAVVRRVLHVAFRIRRDDSHDAAEHLVPVGVVKTDSLLGLVGKDTGIIVHKLFKRRRGKRGVDLLTALRRRDGGRLVQSPRTGCDDRQNQHGDGDAAFLKEFHMLLLSGASQLLSFSAP